MLYALEQERADRKRYPAVNPIDSYSKYLEYPEFEEYIAKRINGEWIGKVNEIKQDCCVVRKLLNRLIFWVMMAYL